MPIYTLEDLLEIAAQLPPLPQAALRAIQLMGSPNASATNLASIIATDPALSAQMLRWANSAYFGMEKRINTVLQAIIVLGVNNIQEMIMAYAVSGHLNKPMPGYNLERGELWQHALGTAIGAKIISQRCYPPQEEEAYFAGLLCDIGKLVLEKLLQKTDLSEAESQPVSFLAVEGGAFGIDHAGLGAAIARSWKLPESLVATIAYHHHPASAKPEHRLLVSAVHVADAAMMILGIGLGRDGLRYPFDEAALSALKMTETDIDQVMEEIANRLSNANELIGAA
jgi:HD-like signal output (HDOD) protein